jgi:sporulation-control protein
MGFKRLLASLGAGGASVDTVLVDVNTIPGGVVQGEVRIQGGTVDQEIQGIALGLQARVEVERINAQGESEEYKRNIEFAKVQVGGAFSVQAGALHSVPFGLEIPWESPITTVAGHDMHGMHVGVRTELQIAKAIDSGDLDPIRIHPMPAQQEILDAFIRLGFQHKHTDLEEGHIHGTRQRLPFYQEFEFRAPPQFRGLKEVEVSFVSDDREMDVVLEMDKKDGLFTNGGDTYRTFRMDLENYQSTDWAAYLNQWIAEVGSRRSWL